MVENRGLFTLVGRKVFVFFSLILFAAIGFRMEVGADWAAYERHIENVRFYLLWNSFNTGDVIYDVIVWLGSNYWGDVYLVNSICSALFVICLNRFLRFTPRPWLAMVVAIPYLVITIAMGYTRQAVAIGFVMMGIVEIINKNPLKFLFWIVIGIGFHKTSIVFFPAIIFALKDGKLIWAILSGLIFSILAVVLINRYMDYFIYQYIEYEYQSSGAGIRLAINALPATMYLLMKKRFDFESHVQKLWSWIAWISLLLFIALMLSPSSTAVDRIALYLLPLQLVIWPRVPSVLKSFGVPMFLSVSLITVFYATVLFVWLVHADNSFAWQPYKFYYWEGVW